MGIKWEQIVMDGATTGADGFRAEVTNGWLVMIKAPNGSTSVTFVSDTHHRWDGTPAGNQPVAEPGEEKLVEIIKKLWIEDGDEHLPNFLKDQRKQ